MIEEPQAEPDYYAILNVPPDATLGEIERAYRELANKRLNARWQPGRAARELTLINMAHGVLAYPERRADYDRRRAEAAARADGAEGEQAKAASKRLSAVAVPFATDGQRRARLGRPVGGSPTEGIVILLAVALALFVGALVASRSLVDLSILQTITDRTGFGRPRAAATPGAGTPVPAQAKPSPAPATATPAQPAAPLGALPTAVTAQLFAGSEVAISDPQPARRGNVSVTLKLVREGQPVPNANVYLTAHYRTVDERQPPSTSTVPTDASGQATITFNIGDATPSYPVNVDVVALVAGQQAVFRTSFTPR
jgi:hypothetical protein